MHELARDTLQMCLWTCTLGSEPLAMRPWLVVDHTPGVEHVQVLDRAGTVILNGVFDLAQLEAIVAHMKALGASD